jgi:F0F1-type ATP synthase beta subunit
LGQHSPFFQSLVPSFVAATKHYYSIKGDKIVEEQNINVFQALSNIVDGEMDDYPEPAFFNVGTIEDVKKKAEELAKSE